MLFTPHDHPRRSNLHRQAEAVSATAEQTLAYLLRNLDTIWDLRDTPDYDRIEHARVAVTDDTHGDPTCDQAIRISDPAQAIRAFIRAVAELQYAANRFRKILPDSDGCAHCPTNRPERHLRVVK